MSRTTAVFSSLARNSPARAIFCSFGSSLTLGADYRELHDAIARLGRIIDLPFESTFVVQSDDRTELSMLGAALGELCPDDSLMVVGISHDWAFCNAGVSKMNLVAGVSGCQVVRY